MWQSNYAVETFSFQVQQPPSATNLVSTPSFENAVLAVDGLTYHDISINGLAAGDDFNFEFSYDKDNDDLSVSSMPVEVGGTTPNTGTSSGDSFSLGESFSLPMLLVGVGVLLIVGGMLYFFLAGRSNEPKQGRKRHKPSTAAAGGNTYCHECGSRAGSGDKFCKACGAKLRV